MAKSIITYDRELPEIPGRCSWQRPDSYLVKDEASEGGWRIEDSGRRPSTLLLIDKLRNAVDTWREGQYPGASQVTRDLFRYWFDEDHEIPGFPAPFRYHFCQREAIETLAYLVEIVGNRDGQDLVRSFADIRRKDLLSDNIVFQETMDGRRQIRRYVAELQSEGVQELPPPNLRRYAFKMATGSGKTWVMAMAMVWAYFHRERVPGSDLARNFLIVAPNVIVYERLEKDFASNRIFHQLPLIPPGWGPWNQKVILRGESTEPDPSGSLFLTNIQQICESREQPWTPANAVEAILGPKPAKDLASQQRSMLERLKDLKELIVINDEAHHVHDQTKGWKPTLDAIHQSLPAGLALWLDFSATPKDQNGMYYPWTIVDYPLAQAVEDRIVKAPIILSKENDPKQPAEDPVDVNKDNVVDKYGYWIRAAIARWKEHQEAYGKLGKKPVLFITAEKNVYADAIGDYLCREHGFKPSEVLVIHTDSEGEVSKKDLEKARAVARDIDLASNRVKVIVSVMMLKEGWDVRNVSVVLGLRPFTAAAEILPEQVIGRGLRLMTDLGPDTQTLEVLGTRNLLKVLRTQLEVEGVGVPVVKDDPPMSVIVEPIRTRLSYDIGIPITKPRLVRDIRRLSELDPARLTPIYDQEDLAEPFRIRLKMEFLTTDSKVGQVDLAEKDVPMAQELLSSITNRVAQRVGLPTAFAELYPLVKSYVATRCFGRSVDLDEEDIRAHLRHLDLREGIAGYLAREIGTLTVERREIEFSKATAKLSDTKPFSWRRNLPPLQAEHTIFNYVATYNPFERKFAEFLDKADDVLKFASLGTTEQGDSGSQFKVDYLKPSGAIGFYHPDWIVVQQTGEGEVNWIIETKGRVWEGTEAKDEAMTSWCQRITELTGQRWDFARVNQRDFKSFPQHTLAEVLAQVHPARML